ncbi:MAG: hypothetical protein A2666_00590 [Parcubacteria group bacterium RIFCSPHIGHO2_01_FULL_47_10b]|nr:MAG: hypothetical protein A2666_00590 [Parcubacteria group bacterium RIFCSPHIGHO2_01_FULL_47_10b]
MPKNKKLISIVIPCFNEEENIERTYGAVKKVVDSLGTYDFEIIFVDNGSEDASAKVMEKIARRDPTVRAVLLTRNFGPESSGLAGLEYATGDAAILMAADMQDPPELIPDYLHKWEEGYDLVLGQIISTNDNRLLLGLRRQFYKILHRIAYIDIPINVSGFGLIDKKVLQVILAMPERSRFYRGLLAWTGFKRALIPYKRGERKYGRSSYRSIFSYIRHAEKGLFAFSTLPLDIITYVGLFLVLFAILITLAFVIIFYTHGNPITGSATLFLGMMFFGGIQILAMSIVGKYVAIIFEETKNRPHFLVKKVINERH